MGTVVTEVYILSGQIKKDLLGPSVLEVLTKDTTSSRVAARNASNEGWVTRLFK